MASHHHPQHHLHHHHAGKPHNDPRRRPPMSLNTPPTPPPTTSTFSSPAPLSSPTNSNPKPFQFPTAAPGAAAATATAVAAAVGGGGAARLQNAGYMTPPSPPASAPNSNFRSPRLGSKPQRLSLSRRYPLLSQIPQVTYSGSNSLYDLLDQCLDYMTDFNSVSSSGVSPPTACVTISPDQTRPISLDMFRGKSALNLPVDDESLRRYLTKARTFVRKIEGVVGMWGLGRFIAALRGSPSSGEQGLDPFCSVFALRDGDDGDEEDEAGRLVSVKVDVRNLLVEVLGGLKGLNTGKKDDSQATRNELSKVADLIDMLLLSLVPAIEEILVDRCGDGDEVDEKGLVRAFVPEGVVGYGWASQRSRTPSPTALVSGNPAAPAPAPAPPAAPAPTAATAPAPAPAPATRATTRSPEERTSHLVLPSNTSYNNQRTSTSSNTRPALVRRSSSEYIYPPKAQQDRLSTVTANTTATRDTFVYLAQSMRRAVEVEGITEEEMGIGGPGRWGDDGGFGDGDGEGGKKGNWWKGLLGKKKKSTGASSGKTKGWKWRSLGCFRGA